MPSSTSGTEVKLSSKEYKPNPVARGNSGKTFLVSSGSGVELYPCCTGTPNTRYSQLVALIVEVGNTIYVSEETRRNLTGSIEAYLCVHRRWEVDGKRVADCVSEEGNRHA